MRLIACLLLLLQAASAVAQPDGGPIVPRDSAVVVVHDPVRATLFTFAVGQAWRFEFDRDGWQPLGSLRLPSDVTNAAYDAHAQRIVFWNRGVGDVHAWTPGDSTLTRVDRSFPHRAQFDHAAAMDGASGRIYAAGGYGLWTYKDHVTAFDPASGEWTLVPLRPGSPRPAPRRGAAATVWRNALYLLGGQTLPDVRTDVSPDGHERPASDLWRLDVTSGRWEHVGDVDGSYPNGLSVGVRERGTLNVAAVGALDSTNALWYVLNHGGVVAIDLRTGSGHTLTERTSAPAAVGLAFDAPRSRLVVVERQWAHQNTALPLAMRVVPATGLAEVRRGSETRLPASWAWGAGGALVAAMLWGTGRWRRRRQSSVRPGESDVMAPPDSEVPPLTVGLGDSPRVLVYTCDETARFSTMALALLVLLARARLTGRSYVPVAEVEQGLWPTLDPESQRKRRHELTQALDAYRQTMHGGNDPWLMSRSSPDDRRRRELALADTVHVVNEGGGHLRRATVRAA